MPGKKVKGAIKTKGLDVRSTEDIPALMDMFEKNDNAVVLIYADYCGHCHTYRDDVWNHLNKKHGKKMAAVHYDQVDKLQSTPLKDTAVSGYPTVLYVEKGKSPVEVKDSRNMETMESMLNSGEPGVSNEESDSDESISESESLNLDKKSSEKRRKSVLKMSKNLPKKFKPSLAAKNSALPPNVTDDMLNSQSETVYNTNEMPSEEPAGAQKGGSLYQDLLKSIQGKTRRKVKKSKKRKSNRRK